VTGYQWSQAYLGEDRSASWALMLDTRPTHDPDDPGSDYAQQSYVLTSQHPSMSQWLMRRAMPYSLALGITPRIEWGASDPVQQLGLHRMPPTDLEALKTAMGVSDTWIAEALGVRRDTVYQWRRNPAEPIPYRVPGELAAALRALSATATEWATRLDRYDATS